ncbi:THC0290_0291 family protein [Mangrovimonas aestuarii]|uniref:THC0290_0291 family protein n=1 Tax=Mangrovimonas aestuarii TaxID=3018443 RepID=UPI0023790DF2|nr:glutamate dehydrogenase [Mangrovimonas aestuarii]
MPKLPLIGALFCLLFFTVSAYPQLGFSHEIGAIIGPVQFRADFGSRNDEETNFGNSGIGIGIIHYINFAYRADCNCYSTETYFNDHFKIRNEISWNYTVLDHHGTWIKPHRTSDNADRLRGHHGVAENFDIGTQLEYFPRSIRSFQAFSYRFAPFFSLGVHYTAFKPQASTDYVRRPEFIDTMGPNDVGNINDPSNFYSYWEPGSINPEHGTTWSMVTSVGVRYKLTTLSDLMLDLRWQLYFDDWVDGLNHQLSYNKFNDWLVWLNFGYIYYLD